MLFSNIFRFFKEASKHAPKVQSNYRKMQPFDISKDKGEHGIWCGAVFSLDKALFEIEAWFSEASSFLKKIFNFEAIKGSGVGPQISNPAQGGPNHSELVRHTLASQRAAEQAQRNR